MTPIKASTLKSTPPATTKAPTTTTSTTPSTTTTSTTTTTTTTARPSKTLPPHDKLIESDNHIGSRGRRPRPEESATTPTPRRRSTPTPEKTVSDERLGAAIKNRSELLRKPYRGRPALVSESLVTVRKSTIYKWLGSKLLLFFQDPPVVVKEPVASTSAPKVYESRPRFPAKISSVAPEDQVRLFYFTNISSL